MLLIINYANANEHLMGYFCDLIVQDTQNNQKAVIYFQDLYFPPCPDMNVSYNITSLLSIDTSNSSHTGDLGGTGLLLVSCVAVN